MAVLLRHEQRCVTLPQSAPPSAIVRLTARIPWQSFSNCEFPHLGFCHLGAAGELAYFAIEGSAASHTKDTLPSQNLSVSEADCAEALSQMTEDQKRSSFIEYKLWSQTLTTCMDSVKTVLKCSVCMFVYMTLNGQKAVHPTDYG